MKMLRKINHYNNLLKEKFPFDVNLPLFISFPFVDAFAYALLAYTVVVDAREMRQSFFHDVDRDILSAFREMTMKTGEN